MTVLLDSDIVIEVLRGRDPSILERWLQLSASDAEVSCTPVTDAEVWRGAKSSEHAQIFELLDGLGRLALDADVGRTAGHYLRQYGKSHGIGLADALIAATAIRHDAALWTRNRKH